MERLKYITIIILLVAVTPIWAFAAKSATVLLQEGLYAEEVDGDLDAAIRSYEQIIKDSTAQRSHVAQALYRQGMCYLKKGDEMRAGAAFEKLVADFNDQTKIIDKVKPMLDELINSDPATLMPPGTLVYVELGSPGKQIETILNMLKGTPFANPLAVIGGGHSERSSGDMMAALFNPSMMAEFKKIRGMAVGITGISQNNPPGVAVLYPGKSDALRGLLLAGLGMVAQPGDPIEGMSTLMFGNEGGIAYDDKVIIISQPLEQLKWSVKQYKSIVSGPTLASSNESFTKISKKARQENALTFWANTDEVYSGVLKQFPPDAIPQEIRMADGIVDIKNIDDVISFFSLEESGIAVETNIGFKNGHHCLVYDMIRTPNLSKAGFEAVPSEAVLLVSVALGDADSAQAAAVSKKINNLTGLDIGREIFANIEQINLFMLPPKSTSGQGAAGLPQIANCIGLAITSHNPQQTHQILMQLLGVANLMIGQSEAKQSAQGVGKYVVGLVNDQKLYCYMNQAGKTTVLSLNSDIVETSVSAINRRSSVLAGGSLNEAVNNLSPTTSKLVMVNVGGAMRLAESNIDLGPRDAENSPHQLIAELAKSCDKTIVQWCTDEKLNNLGVSAALSGLPPVNDVFGTVMQLTEGLSGGKPQAESWEKEEDKAPVAVVTRTNQAPVIDGKAEGLWASAQKYKLTNAIYSSMPSQEDLSAEYRVIWDEDNLYLFVDVTDDKLIRDSGEGEWYFDDCVEVFVDADDSKSDSYGDNDGQYHFNWDKSDPQMANFQHGEVDNVEFAMMTTENGYRTEIKFPWSTLKADPSKLVKIGLDVHVNDDDDGGERDTKITWSDKEDIAWQVPRVFGTVLLRNLVGWWKFDEAQGSNASDSSGNNLTGVFKGDPQWQPSGGVVGGALKLDGEDDYVDTEFKTDLPVWTIAIWAKSPEAPTEEMPTCPITREKNYQINWDHAQDPFRGAVGVSVGGEWHAASFGNLEANIWYHLAATYDRENLKAYKDGVLVTDNPAPSGQPQTEGETLKFGKNAIYDFYFKGAIDDARVYSYALDKDEIKKIYSEGKQK